MANLYFHNPQSNERALKAMHCKLTIGAAGAVTLSRGAGFVSAAKSATGEITITLAKFSSFVSANVILESATSVDNSFQIKSVNPATGVIVIFTKIAGSNADLASGSVLHVDLLFKNTSVKI